MWIAEVISYLLQVPQKTVEKLVEGEAYNAVEQFVGGYTRQVNNGQCYAALYAFVGQAEDPRIQNAPPPQDLVTPVVVLTRRTAEGTCPGDAIEEPEDANAS